MPSPIRHSLNASQALKRFLYNAFILPFQDPQRGYIYFTSFFFALGFAFLDIFIALDVAAMGQRELTEYIVAKLGAISIIIPIALWLMGRIPDSLLYLLLLSLSLAGLACMIFMETEARPLEIGLLYASAVSPFWAMYHCMFASATSDKNLGNEVSLAGTGMTIGMTFGAVLGGFCSQYELNELGLYLGFIILILSNLALIIRALKTKFTKTLKNSGAMDESLWGALKRCKYRSVGSFLEGIFQAPTGNLWVAFLSLSGITAAAVGIWQAVMVLVKIVVTPLAGSLVNHGRRREMLLGAGLNLFGWVPFLYGFTSFFVLLFMNIWAVGIQLFTTGLTSAWYGSRTVAAIIVREIIIGVGRVGCALVLIPLLYNDVQNFINTVVVIAAVMVIYAALWMRSVKTKGPVMPIESIVTNRR